jgi:hypothetical protein
MSQEIIDAVRDIEREKGIESGTLVAALEDALLAAYKKMPDPRATPRSRSTIRETFASIRSSYRRTSRDA